jgi:hypothetical protein
VPVLGLVAGHELIQVGPHEGRLLEGKGLVRAQVVDPHLSGPRRLAGRLAVEEEHVGLDALRVEDAGRQAQEGVHVALVQELAAHDLARAALEEHVVGHDDRRAAVHRRV